MNLTPSRRKRNSDLARREKLGDVWSAFDDFFNSRFGDLPMTTELNNFNPEVNIKESKDSIVIEAELAGLKRDEIDIEFRGDHLVLRGDKKSFEEDSKDDYYHMERRYGSFYRAIPLDEKVDDTKCDASFKDGLLTITLPKKEGGQKSKKINIQ